MLLKVIFSARVTYKLVSQILLKTTDIKIITLVSSGRILERFQYQQSTINNLMLIKKITENSEQLY